MSLREKCKIGYCTNVHAGVSINMVKSNLMDFAIPVKNSFRPDLAMGIGLWLARDAAADLLASNQVFEFSGWLKEKGLEPFTFNAFPFGDFHQEVVKHKVYEPTWADKQRLDYTLSIAKIQSQLLDEGSFGSVSTLPLGWPNDTSKEFMQVCATNLKNCASELERLKEQTGRHIFVCIEPEPGCIFDLSQHIVHFFETYLLNGSETENERILRHIGVCHDVCHAAVMGESQLSAIDNYQRHQIHVGKFQISSAIRADFEEKSDDQKEQMLGELKSFAEDRYLHQTMISQGGNRHFREDLPIALEEFGSDPGGVWTIHFHVPLFAERLGTLGTTQNEIADLVSGISVSDRYPIHFEVETYAWTVLPDSLRPKNLSDGIAKELEYFSKVAAL